MKIQNNEFFETTFVSRNFTKTCINNTNRNEEQISQNIGI